MNTNLKDNLNLSMRESEILPARHGNRRNTMAASNAAIDRSANNTVERRYRGMNVKSPGDTDMTSLNEAKHTSPEP